MNGVIGARAPNPAVVATLTAPALTIQHNMEVAIVMTLLKRVSHATLAIAQLMVMRMNGVIGARAQRPAAVAASTAPAVLPQHSMEVANVLPVLLRVAPATLPTAPLTALRVHGALGARALRPVVMVPKPALAL
jgi:hypothetical protein